MFYEPSIVFLQDGEKRLLFFQVDSEVVGDAKVRCLVYQSKTGRKLYVPQPVLAMPVEEKPKKKRMRKQ